MSRIEQMILWEILKITDIDRCLIVITWTTEMGNQMWLKENDGQNTTNVEWRTERDGRNVTDGIRLVDILQYDKHNRKDLE